MLVSALNLTGDVKMKYEYLKGSEKDFEGAPDSCMQAIRSNADGSIGFCFELDYMCAYHDKLSPVDGDRIMNPAMFKVIAERRPVTEPSWDCVGLPPVGCECEFTLGPYEPDEFDDLCGKLPEPGTLVNVVSHKVTGDGHNVAVIYWDEDGGGRAACLIGSCLKPIRSEADKKRDAVIHEIAEAMVAPQPKGNGILAQAISVYNKIAAGKIPGVKLED